MKRALRPGGIVCSQADTFWGHLKNATSMHNHCKEVFAKAAYATSYVSTYPAGQIGFALGSLDKVRINRIIDNYSNDNNNYANIVVENSLRLILLILFHCYISYIFANILLKLDL